MNEMKTKHWLKKHWLLILIVFFGAVVFGTLWNGNSNNQPNFQVRLSPLTLARFSLENELLNHPNVVGIGEINGKLRVCVIDKMDLSLSVPQSVDGFQVEVIETGPLSIMGYNDEWRPIPGGVSLGHKDVSAGTFSVSVYDRDTNDQFMLSNNHVIAMSSTVQHQRASVGDEVLQPAPWDGGRIPYEVCARLDSWINIDEEGNNVVDCALARPLNEDEVNNEILGIGLVSNICPYDEIEAYENLQNTQFYKCGRTTGVTWGFCWMKGSAKVRYGDFNATFLNQIWVISHNDSDPTFIEGGDSGSLLVTRDGTNRASGLLFAGGMFGILGVANPIEAVLDSLNVNLPSTHDLTPPKRVPRFTEVSITVSVNIFWYGETESTPFAGEIWINGHFMGVQWFSTIISEPDKYVIKIKPEQFSKLYGYHYCTYGALDCANPSVVDVKEGDIHTIDIVVEYGVVMFEEGHPPPIEVLIQAVLNFFNAIIEFFRNLFR